MTTQDVKQKQKRAKAICLAAIKAAFAKKGIVEITLSDLRDPAHPLQRFPLAVRNSATDHKGAVFEHAYEVIEHRYDGLSDPKCTNPGTDFQYRAFNLERDSPMDVLAFIDDCDDPEEVIDYVIDWQKRIINQRRFW